MSAPNPPALLLFDLGKVIVEVTGAQQIQKHLVNPLPDVGWPAKECWDAFERGQITSQEFATRFIADVPLNTDPETLLADFALWCGDAYPGSKATLEALRPRFRCAALSNSNAIHWERLQSLGVLRLFERAFSSHLLGMRKPEPEIYQHVLKELAVHPEAAVFFDDLEENVQAAKGIGMRAYRVEGDEALRACLREIGCLDGV